MRISVLASGSSGNACFIETPKTTFLVDAGLSCRELCSRLESIRIDHRRLDGLIITHEHIDHIRGAGPLARLLDIPVYMNHGTLKRGMKRIGSLSQPVPFHTGQSFQIKDLLVETFSKCHDAADPVGLVLSANGTSLGVLTDVGRTTNLVEDRLKGCRNLILEFNHDPAMLENGPYPWPVKRRIKGPEGHLSNHQAGELLRTLSHDSLDLVILAHLSGQNNRPDIAVKTAREALASCGRKQTKIILSLQDSPTPIQDLR